MRSARGALAGPAFSALALFLYVAASVVGGALLAFPVHTLLQGSFDVRFESVLHRVVALTLLLCLPFYLATSAGSTRRQALGLACTPGTFVRRLFSGFALGILVASPLIGAFLLLGIRSPTLSEVSGPTEVGVYLASALLAAIIVGILEEAYFRGALLAPLRLLPAWTAVSLVSFFYAGAHFLGAPVATERVAWYSGLSSLGRSQVSLDAFLALFAAGLLLGAMRYRFGNIAIGAGFHAGWVWVIKLNQEYVDVDPSSDLLFLHGGLGGTMGYLGLAWMGLLGAGWLGWEKLRSRSATR